MSERLWLQEVHQLMSWSRISPAKLSPLYVILGFA